jgi:hypothetical protein
MVRYFSISFQFNTFFNLVLFIYLTGNNHPHLSNYPKHHTIVDIKNFSANLFNSIEENTNFIKESNSYQIDDATDSLDTLCSCMEITSNLPVNKDNYQTTDNKKSGKNKTPTNKSINEESGQNRLSDFVCFTDIASNDRDGIRQNNEMHQEVTCQKTKSILKQISKFVEDGSTKVLIFLI